MTPPPPSAELLLRHAGEALIAVDPATLTIVQANGAAARWLRYADALPGRAISEIDISLQSAVYWNEVANGVREDLDRVQTQYRRGDGSLVDVVQSVFAAAEEGRDYLVVRAAEARPAAAAEEADYTTQLRTILEATAEGILVLDAQDRVVNINHRLALLWSLPGHVVARGDSTQILAFMAGQLIAPVEAQSRLRVLISCGHPQVAQILALRDGRTLEKRSQPHLIDGSRIGTILTFTEVTDRLRAEQTLKSDRDYLVDLVGRQIADLRRARDEAEQANRAKSDFLATISHELRTPMHAILSFSSFGERGHATDAPEQLNRYFMQIGKAGNRLLGLINDLLDLSKSRAGKLSVDREPQDIRPVIDEAVRELSALAESRRIRVACDCGPRQARAEIDGPRFGQVVRNLLSNAIKFTPPGGLVQLHLSSEADAGGSLYRLEVSDSGPGIPAGELELIFGKFEQGKGAAGGGTGLGLAIARELMLGHGGSITAANNPQGGATFSLLLPACEGTLDLSCAAPAAVRV